MTNLMVERIGIESTGRSERALRHARERSLDDLGGRTLWCAAGLPDGRRRAHALQAALARSTEAGIRTTRLDVVAHERVQRLAERLAALLASSGAIHADLAEADRALYTEALDASETWLGRCVQPGDVVVLHDPLAALLTSAARERGAHAVWHLRPHGGLWRTGAAEALTFVQRYATPLDAYVLASVERVGYGHLVERIAALMPAAGIVAEKDVTLRGAERRGSAQEATPEHDSAWTSTLAHVVESDRDEAVGGRLHARPVVAGR